MAEFDVNAYIIQELEAFHTKLFNDIYQYVEEGKITCLEALKTIDDYYNDKESWNYEKYMKQLDKARTRGLTSFYFNDKYNKDIQDYDGKQINPDYEFAGIVVSTGIEGITTIEIRNKLSVGDKLEVMVPNILEPYEMTIEKLYDAETGEEIATVNPGVKEQKVKLRIPVDVKPGYIIRRIKA